jgi:hypothetical protein
LGEVESARISFSTSRRAPLFLRIRAAKTESPDTWQGSIRLVNLADNSDLFDVYIHGAGDLLPDVIPSFVNLPFRSTTSYLNRNADSYEITITEAGEKVAIAPPLSLDLALGDVIDLAILDTADPNVFDLVIYGN